MTDSKASAAKACETCPSFRAGGLQPLGINTANWDFVVALAGNPNTGKSTVFNQLTGLRQHTGNWPGKTVVRAEGGFHYGSRKFKLVDLPGTYSLLATSPDEEVARNFLLFGRPDVTLAVVDATRLERNLNLVLQILEITPRVVVCLNLVDQANRIGLQVDERRLARDLGVPVVPTTARYRQGIDLLLETVHDVATGKTRCRGYRFENRNQEVERALAPLVSSIHQSFPGLPNARWLALRLLDGDERVIEAVRRGEFSSLGRARLPSSPNSLPAAAPAREDTRPPQVEARANEDEDDPPPGSSSSSSFSSSAPRIGQEILSQARALRWEMGSQFHEKLVETIYADAARLADRAITRPGDAARPDLDRSIDRLVTSRLWGIPLMILLFALVFWITIIGANVPSRWLASLLIDRVYPWLNEGALQLGVVWWLRGLLIDGVYLATAWVVSVMLPPMAIFFPLFTFLEDFGYLPRVAFNLDNIFRKAGAHGKQALTMMMGFGCNAAGITATRIIDSPRERLIAMITNNFALCNGRWPTQILIASLFIGALAPSYLAGLVSSAAVVGIAMLGVVLSLGASWFLSRTALRGEVSSFSLELPPYRPPRLGQIIYASLIDRTIYVLWRALVFAAPAGAVIWLVANVQLGGVSLAEHIVGVLNPVGVLIGLNGVILLAYLIAIPANEIVVPTVLMLTVLTARVGGVGSGAGVMFELDNDADTLAVLRTGGWTLLTGVNLMLFSLLHNPCSTTLYTIYKESGSLKWAAVAALLPLALGFVVCFFVAQVWRLLAAG